jgi:hypothetical protein
VSSCASSASRPQTRRSVTAFIESVNYSLHAFVELSVERAAGRADHAWFIVGRSAFSAEVHVPDKKRTVGKCPSSMRRVPAVRGGHAQHRRRRWADMHDHDLIAVLPDPDLLTAQLTGHRVLAPVDVDLGGGASDDAALSEGNL